MTVQYASDLHLEFPQNKKFLEANPLQPKGEVLVLAGDIVPFAVMDEYKDFFSYVSDNFETVYWIPGNHEYYYSDLTNRSGALYEKIRENVFLVNNHSVQHGGIHFIFSTLWSEIKPANQWRIENELSDFHVIKLKGDRFATENFNQLHRESFDFVSKELQLNLNCKKVAVSHHVPTFFNYPEEYKNSRLNEAFAVELYDLIEKTQPDYWIYGHTHINTPGFKIGKTELLTNQLGYIKYKEHGYFSPNKFFNI